MTLKKKVAKSHTAVIVIDIQNDFCHEEGAVAKSGKDVTNVKKVIPKLQYFLENAKFHEVPIIYVQTIHHDYTNSAIWTSRIDGKGSTVCSPSSWGANFYEITPDATDIVLEKHRYSAFFNTPLDSILRSLKIKDLIIMGVSTSVCVDTTTRDGFMRDYRVIVPTDTSAAYTTEEHHHSLNVISYYFGETCLSQEILDEWEKV